MSRIKRTFENGKAFIPFITCGDPHLDITEKLIYAMEEAGADLIELGIPFSDPTAEGSVIQASSLRALQAGVTTDKVFETIKRIRKNTQIPLAIMTYANIVFSYGTERFVKRMNELEVGALILPDVPFEEKLEFSTICEKHNIDLISLIAPTSKNRIARIAKDARGFIYCVSSLGVTGTRTNISTDIGEIAKDIKNESKVPCAIGFGISTPEQARDMAILSDGVIVGSAIVKLCEKHGKECVPIIKNFVSEMVEAIKDIK